MDISQRSRATVEKGSGDVVVATQSSVSVGHRKSSSFSPCPSKESSKSMPNRADLLEVDDDEDSESVLEECSKAFRDLFRNGSSDLLPSVKRSSPSGENISVKQPKLSEEVKTLKPPKMRQDLPRILHRKVFVEDDSTSSHQRDSVNLDELLSSPSNLCQIAPVNYFPHAPLADIWNQIALPGLTIELRNPYVEGTDECYWLANVVHYAGYRALVKFENFDSNQYGIQYLSWISFCSVTPKYLGWCADNQKEMNAGKIVSKKLPLERFIQEITKVYEANKPTVALNHVDIINHIINDKVTLDLGSTIEAIDVLFPSRCRLGKIVAIVGDRVHVKYHGRDENHMVGLWCTVRSQMIFPLGWCKAVGAILFSNANSETSNLPLSNDYAPKYPKNLILKQGMRLEARHPIFQHKFVGALVRKVLKFGYFIMETCDENVQHRIRCIVHVTSPFVFPVGWSKSCANFSKVEFSGSCNPSVHEHLRLELLPKRSPHNFKVGMKVEAIHHQEPSMALLATIVDVADHMLLIRYDSNLNIKTFWNELDLKSNQVWVDNEQCVYPVGYSELVGLDGYRTNNTAKFTC